MKNPKKRRNNDEVPGDEEFYERLMRLTGIPNPAVPPSFLRFVEQQNQTSAVYEAFLRSMEQGRTERKTSIADVLEDKPVWAGHTVVSRSEHECCPGIRDGLIFFALNKKGSVTVVANTPNEAHVAIVRILAVDEHTGHLVAINSDAESMKQLMNALPGLIKAAEDARDDAIAILAGD